MRINAIIIVNPDVSATVTYFQSLIGIVSNKTSIYLHPTKKIIKIVFNCIREMSYQEVSVSYADSEQNH